MEFGGAIHPNEYTVISNTIEVEQGQKSLQQAEKELPKKEEAAQKKV